MKSALLLVLFLASASAQAANPTMPSGLFELQTIEPVEYVRHQSSQADCADANRYLGSDEERAGQELVLGVMLAAQESGMSIVVVEEEACFRP